MMKRLLVALGLVLGGAVQPPEGWALPISVVIDTSALAGTAAQLAFDLVDGDSVPGNNTATISGFASAGSLGAGFPTGDVIGALPGPVVISESQFFGELLQEITLGSVFSCVLDATTSFGGSPGDPRDRFSLSLLDPASSFTLVDTNLAGDALLTVDSAGGALIVSVPATSTPAVGLSVTAVPAPGAISLLVAGLSLVLWRRAAAAASARQLL